MCNNMINLSHKCVYQCPILIDATDLEKELMKEELYKEDLLKILELTEFDEIKINEKILLLRNDFLEIDELNSICKLLSEYVGDKYNEFGFMILFSIDYLYLIYDFFKKFYTNNKEVDNDILIELRDLIKKTMEKNTLPQN